MRAYENHFYSFIGMCGTRGARLRYSLKKVIYEAFYVVRGFIKIKLILIVSQEILF